MYTTVGVLEIKYELTTRSNELGTLLQWISVDFHRNLNFTRINSASVRAFVHSVFSHEILAKSIHRRAISQG